MRHKSPVVRGYAFWGLAKQYYKDLDNLYEQHKNDSEYVNQIEGCIGGEIPLNAFLTWVVTPNRLDLECKKLKKRR